MGDVLSSASGIMSRTVPENSAQDVKKTSSKMPDTIIKTVKLANFEDSPSDERRMNKERENTGIIRLDNRSSSQPLTQDFGTRCDTPKKNSLGRDSSPISELSDSEKIVSSVALSNNLSASSRRTQNSFFRQTIDSAIASDILSCSTQQPSAVRPSAEKSTDCERSNSAEAEEDSIDGLLTKRLSQCLLSAIGNVSLPETPRNVFHDRRNIHNEGDQQSQPSSISSFESLTGECTIANREDNEPTQIGSPLDSSPKTNTLEPESLWKGSQEFLESESPVLEMMSIVKSNTVGSPYSISIGTNISLSENVSPKTLLSDLPSLNRCESSNDFSSEFHAKSSPALKTGNRSGVANNSAGKVSFSKDFTGSDVGNTTSIKDGIVRKVAKRKLDRSEYKENSPATKSPRFCESIFAELSASSKSNSSLRSQTRHLEFEDGESSQFSEPAKKKVRLCPAGHVRRSPKTRRREIARRILTPFYVQRETTEQRVLTSPHSDHGHEEIKLVDLTCDSDDEILAEELPTDENDNCGKLTPSRRNSESEIGSCKISPRDSESRNASHETSPRNSKSQTESHEGSRRNSRNAESESGSPTVSRSSPALEIGSPTLLSYMVEKAQNSSFLGNETFVTINSDDEENDITSQLNARGSNDSPSFELPTPAKKEVRLCVPELSIKSPKARSSFLSRRNLTPFYAQPKNTNRHKLTPFYPDQNIVEKRPRSTQLNSRAEKERPQLMGTNNSDEAKNKKADEAYATLAIELLAETGSPSFSSKGRTKPIHEQNRASFPNIDSVANQSMKVDFLSDRCCEYELTFKNISCPEIVPIIPKLLKDLVKTSAEVIERNINNAITIVDISVAED